MRSDAVILSVRNWVQEIVIGLQLCPFAKSAMMKDSVRFVHSDADTEEQLLLDLKGEIELLELDNKIETTLLIHPEVLHDFVRYNQFLGVVEVLFEELELEGVYQVASFHPQYQFAETDPDDVENYTNRSPYPILHILREASVDLAIETYPDTDLIPERNIALLREMGTEKIKKMLQSCFHV